MNDTTSTQITSSTEMPINRVTQDGIDHINTHNRGLTELGRMLAHFYHAPFSHPFYGPFNNVEGFWQYLRSNGKDDAYRTLNGHRAKARAKKLSNVTVKIPNMQEIILAANYAKVEAHPEIKELLIASTLPFDHYYTHGPGEIVIHPRGSEWLVPLLEELRNMFKEGRSPDPIDYLSLKIGK